MESMNNPIGCILIIILLLGLGSDKGSVAEKLALIYLIIMNY